MSRKSPIGLTEKDKVIKNGCSEIGYSLLLGPSCGCGFCSCRHSKSHFNDGFIPFQNTEHDTARGTHFRGQVMARQETSVLFNAHRAMHNTRVKLPFVHRFASKWSLNSALGHPFFMITRARLSHTTDSAKTLLVRLRGAIKPPSISSQYHRIWRKP